VVTACEGWNFSRVRRRLARAKATWTQTSIAFYRIRSKAGENGMVSGHDVDSLEAASGTTCQSGPRRTAPPFLGRIMTEGAICPKRNDETA
jgi:hypothetical protein